MSERAHALLHPVRFRLVESLTQPATIAELLERMPDVSQASLYRHIKVLEEAHLIEPESPGERGTRWRVHPGATLSTRDVAQMRPEEHATLFSHFAFGLIARVDHALTRGVDPGQDGLHYATTTITLTPARQAQLESELRALLAGYVQDTEGRPVTLATALIPSEPTL